MLEELYEQEKLSFTQQRELLSVYWGVDIEKITNKILEDSQEIIELYSQLINMNILSESRIENITSSEILFFWKGTYSSFNSFNYIRHRFYLEICILVKLFMYGNSHFYSKEF